MQDKKKSLDLMAFGIAVMFGVYWIYNYKVKTYIPASDGIKTIMGLVCLYEIGLGLFSLIIKNISIKKVDKKKIPGKTIILCFLLQFTAIVILIIITNILSAAGMTHVTTEIASTSFYMLFMLLIFNPVIEEIVFRKMFADRLYKYGESFYILVSSFCFAIVHGVSLGIPQIVYTFILGMIWSYLYVKTGNLVLVILMHALSNLFGSVISQTLMGISMVAAGIYSIVIILCGIIGFILFIVNKKKIMADEGKSMIKASVIKDMISSKGLWAYVLLTAVMMIIK